MLVEDDKSLREIYGVRLLAESYEIISAGDGEEALAMAVKEKPDLILSDVMMPKISGFDMLDILRSTPETKDIKVIMMTALSSEDQRSRGETLGANRYLVKSQVGIEDVVRTVHDVLSDGPVIPNLSNQKFGIPAQSAAIINKPIIATARTPDQTISTVPTPTPPIGVINPLTTSKPNEPIILTTPTVATTTSTAMPKPNEPIFLTTPTVTTTNSVPIETVTATTLTPNVNQTQTPQPTSTFPTPATAPTDSLEIKPIEPIEPVPDMEKLINQELHDGSETNPEG